MKADPEFEGYYIIWLDETGKEIGDEWTFKPSYEQAVRAVGLRLYQSPHKCPPSAGGFYIEPLASWQKRHK